MKKFITLLILSLFCFHSIKAQITAGDIAIIAMNADNNASPVLGENFVFVALKDIPANTTITFTDCAWNSTADTFRTNEGYIQWEHTAIVPAGTVIVMNSSSSNSWATPAPSLGTATGVTTMAFSTDGDQIIAFEGTWATRPTVGSSSRFLYAFSLENFITIAPATSQESNLPTALASFHTAMKNTNAETDNAYFADGTATATAVSVSGTKLELLTKFMDSTKYYQSNTLSALPTYTVTVQAAVPLSLKSFNGSLINKEVSLVWNTANEVNVDGFAIEKSNDARNFKQIGFVAAKNAATSTYSFNDVVEAGVYYYRLKMSDKDGSFKYSSVVAVNSKPTTKLDVYPNPVKNTATLTHELAGTKATIKVVSIEGKNVVSQNIQIGATQSTIDVSKLVRGNYLIVFENEGTRTSLQFVKH